MWPKNRPKGGHKRQKRPRSHDRTLEILESSELKELRELRELKRINRIIIIGIEKAVIFRK